jgi:serine/threonine protein kinase
VSRTPPNIELDETALRDPLIGHVVLGYRISRVLGEGGMGLVYEAEDPKLGRKAAVKVLRAEVAEDEAVVARFRAEAKAANTARHRGIVDVFGFVTLPDGREAIVMEFLQGTSLDDELRRRGQQGLPQEQALSILDEVAAVLVAAHGKGVVHRDLKPSNVFLCRDDDGKRHVKVLDFGIAKTEASTAKTTVAIMGTPDYMSPEQASGRAAHPSMDLYSLGCIAFELFTGRMPFSEPTLTALLLAHQHKPPPTPSSLQPSLPPSIDRLVLTLLAKHPEERFQSAAEVRVAIEDVRAEAPSSTARTSRTVESAWPRRARWLVPLALVLAAASGGGVWFALHEPRVDESVVAEALPQPQPLMPVVEPPASPPPPPVEEALAEPPSEPLSPIAAPRRVSKPVSTPAGPVDRRAALQTRLSRLSARLTAAERNGADVTLERSQVRKLEQKLSEQPADGRLTEQVDIALQRLEEALP